jgi:hypothetical protein
MLSKPNKMAKTLGWLGGIPFILAAVFSFSTDPALIMVSAELASRYGLAIIIFLGAVHWGIAMDSNMNGMSLRYVWSVMPALVATLILFLEPLPSLSLVIGLLIICWLMDMLFHLNTAMPEWYIRLRHGLTIIAVGSVTIVSIRVSALGSIWP